MKQIFWKCFWIVLFDKVQIAVFLTCNVPLISNSESLQKNEYPFQYSVKPEKNRENFQKKILLEKIKFQNFEK